MSSIHSDSIYRNLGRINLGLDGEDTLGSRINFFPRKSLPISIFLSLLSKSLNSLRAVTRDFILHKPLLST